ncbi:MAG: RNA 2',3'-cyclic phosphodiesterase [Dehalococcoidaceae bacterium]|nr:RNA 2',3'-cyclic phosphodiesterase [Dehalococcoidaceae bacterium]
MESIRLFVSVELPVEVKQELGKLQDRLRPNGLENLKWVAPESIHITLKFLGYVKPEMVGDIEQEIDETASAFGAFDIGLKGLGAFPSLSRPQVLWVGLSGEVGRLQMLAGQLEEQFTKLGFAAEKRRFVPHLTLARVRPGTLPGELQALAEAVSKTSFNFAYPVKVNSVNLMQSRLAPEGAVYTRLHQARLKLKPA